MRITRSGPRVLLLLSLSIALVVATGVTLWPSPAEAQSGVVTWSGPIKLPAEGGEDAGYPRFPTLAVDPWGGVHVFWVQREWDEGSSNLIYYARGDGALWSQPHDLFADSRGWAYDMPYATCDREGRIHLLWAGIDGLYYSSASALEADDVRAWQPAQALVRTAAMGKSRLLVDQSGTLHVVYGRRSPGANVMYLRSDDAGLSWSLPVQVSDISTEGPQAPEVGQMAIDSRGILHLVWEESWPPLWIGRHVFYAHSTDGGETWTSPTDLSDRASDDDWDAVINLAIDSQDGISAVWGCGASSPGRCWRYSDDGGESWSGIHRLFEGLVGRGGNDTMASDPYGHVYWAGLLRYPQGFYFSFLEDGHWYEPAQQVFSESDEAGLAEGHWPHLAVQGGNQIHLVLTGWDQGPLWYVRGDSGQPSLPVPPMPSLEVSLTRQSKPTPPTLTPEPTVAPRQPTPFASAAPQRHGLAPILSGMAPVLLVVLASIAIKMRSRHG